jgi:hypothetical protein
MGRTIGGQSINFETTGRQLVNGLNHKWIKYTFPFKLYKN